MISTAVLILLTQVDPPSLGTQPGGLDGGEPFGSARMRCSQCHDRAILEAGSPIYMPYDGWVSTMMANSVRDPLFQAALSVANQDVPGLGSWCLRCHAPQSFIRGHNVPPDGGGFDEVDTEGVTCDVCHRALPAPDSGSPVIGNAQIYFERGNVKWGPYEDIFNSAHAAADGGITDQSELCGQCHQVFNPLVAWRNPDDGGVLGPAFPLDTTYDEWKQSQYASGPTQQTCQDCHMPRMEWADGGTEGFFVAKFGERREKPRRHVFAGGNLWGLDAVQANDPATAAAFPDQFAETKRQAEEMLHKAATLTVSVSPATVKPGGIALITVHVKNNAGHKLPTGYADGRRIVVQMLLDGVAHTGGFDAGYLVDDGWLRIYEIKHAKYGVGPEEHLAQHDMIYGDSRLLPSGFNPPPGAPTRPVPEGLYAAGDGGFLDYDEVTWDVDVPNTLKNGDTFNVSVRLMFQSTTPEYVDFLHSENTTTDRGRNLLDIWKATGEAAPFEMARVDTPVPVSTGMGGGSGGGSGGSGGAGGGVTMTGGGGEPINAKCGCGNAGPALLLLLGLALRRMRRNRPHAA